MLPAYRSGPPRPAGPDARDLEAVTRPARRRRSSGRPPLARAGARLHRGRSVGDRGRRGAGPALGAGRDRGPGRAHLKEAAALRPPGASTGTRRTGIARPRPGRPPGSGRSLPSATRPRRRSPSSGPPSTSSSTTRRSATIRSSAELMAGLARSYLLDGRIRRGRRLGRTGPRRRPSGSASARSSPGRWRRRAPPPRGRPER